MTEFPTVLTKQYMWLKHPEELMYLLQHKYIREEGNDLYSNKSDKPLLLEEIDAIILWVKQQLV